MGDPIERELLRIGAMPRFAPGTTELLGPVIQFTDAPSFIWMYREIFQRGIYAFEPSRPLARIIDAGANIGLSVAYLKKRFPSALVLAIEADPRIYEVLKGNVQALSLRGVELQHCALWDEETQITFASQGADAGRVADAETSDFRERVEVSTALLSSLVDGPVDLLKIDIEGAELRVLQEAKRSLAQVERIFVEYHSFRRETQQLAELLQLLREAGFRVVIQSVGVPSQPFLQKAAACGMDMQLNIFGTRT